MVRVSKRRVAARQRLVCARSITLHVVKDYDWWPATLKLEGAYSSVETLTLPTILKASAFKVSTGSTLVLAPTHGVEPNGQYVLIGKRKYATVEVLARAIKNTAAHRIHFHVCLVGQWLVDTEFVAALNRTPGLLAALQKRGKVTVSGFTEAIPVTSECCDAYVSAGCPTRTDPNQRSRHRDAMDCWGLTAVHVEAVDGAIAVRPVKSSQFI